MPEYIVTACQEWRIEADTKDEAEQEAYDFYLAGDVVQWQVEEVEDR